MHQYEYKKSRRSGSSQILKSAVYKNRIVTGDADGNVYIWDLNTNQIVLEYKHHGHVECVAIHERFVVSHAYKYSETWVWDIVSGEKKWDFQGGILTNSSWDAVYGPMYDVKCIGITDDKIAYCFGSRIYVKDFENKFLSLIPGDAIPGEIWKVALCGNFLAMGDSSGGVVVLKTPMKFQEGEVFYHDVGWYKHDPNSFITNIDLSFNRVISTGSDSKTIVRNFANDGWSFENDKSDYIYETLPKVQHQHLSAKISGDYLGCSVLDLNSKNEITVIIDMKSGEKVYEIQGCLMNLAENLLYLELAYEVCVIDIDQAPLPSEVFKFVFPSELESSELLVNVKPLYTNPIYIKGLIKRYEVVEIFYRQDSKDGNTLLHCMIKDRNIEFNDFESIIDVLKDAGGLFLIKNNDGDTALDIAIQNRLVRETEILLSVFVVDFHKNNEESICINGLYHSMYSYFKKTFINLVKIYPQFTAVILESSIHEVKTISNTMIPFGEDLYESNRFLDPLKSLLLDDTEKSKDMWGEVSNKKNGYHQQHHVEIETLVVGFPNFLECNGPYHTIVDYNQPNIKSFETLPMRAAITYKWKLYARNIHTFQTLLYSSAFFLLVCGQLQSLQDNTSDVLPILFLYSSTISFLFLIFEIFQLSISIKRKDIGYYVYSGWNWLQISSYICMLLSSFSFAFMQTKPGTLLSIFGGWTNILLSFNALSFLRPYSWCGPLIRMLIQIINDMVAFLVVQVIILFGFTIGFAIMMNENTSFQGAFAFMTGYTMLLGDFDLSDFQIEDDKYRTNSALFAFSMYMLFVPVITMNLLIAIMGDSYDYVRENQSLYGLMEKAKIINEIDDTFHIIFNENLRNNFFPKYFHILRKKNADSMDDSEDNPWEGHLNKIQRKIDQCENKIKDKIEKKLNEKNNKLEQKIDQISKLLVEKDGKVEQLEGKIDILSKMISQIAMGVNDITDEVVPSTTQPPRGAPGRGTPAPGRTPPPRGAPPRPGRGTPAPGRTPPPRGAPGRGTPAPGRTPPTMP